MGIRPPWAAALVGALLTWAVLHRRAAPAHAAQPPQAGSSSAGVSGDRAGGKDAAREEAERLFERARERLREVRGTDGEERTRRVCAALAALRAVRIECPEARELGALAAFRAGELMRSAGYSLAARVEFRAAEGGEETLARRARLELAHLERRAGRLQSALEGYYAVCKVADSNEIHCARARLWAGRMASDLGRVQEAERLWSELCASAIDPLVRIAAFDERVLVRIEGGALEAAAGVLHECRNGMREAAAEASPRGERVRGALENMRCVARLERAIAIRRDAARAQDR